MKMNSNRKGAVEMSLNLIIMLIIGIVVLGLVIGFVNSLVNKGKGTFENQIGEQDQLKLDEVSNCKDNLCILPKPTVTVRKGEQNKVYIKVRNVGDTNMNCNPGLLLPEGDCRINVFIISGSEPNTNLFASTAGDNAKFTLEGQGFVALQSGTEASRMYTINPGTSVLPGTYYVTIGLDATDNDDVSTYQSPIVLTLQVE